MEHPELYGPDHAHPQGLARAKAAMDAADRARIEAENTTLSKARTYLGFASDHLHLARFDASIRALMRSMAIDDLRTACAALGYDLVKRDD
jgi:uncharacterized membrane protein YidH (DUF202 family)